MSETTDTPAGGGRQLRKTVLDCGNCGPDFAAIRQLLVSRFDAAVIQSHGAEDTLQILRSRPVALVTVNRKLDRDYSDGLEVIKAIKADPELNGVPVMLISNYEEHQRTAIEAGCVPGFGKLALRDAATLQVLEPFLGS
jgi:CheY-like chemotaxis protein